MHRWARSRGPWPVSGRGWCQVGAHSLQALGKPLSFGEPPPLPLSNGIKESTLPQLCCVKTYGGDTGKMPSLREPRSKDFATTGRGLLTNEGKQSSAARPTESNWEKPSAKLSAEGSQSHTTRADTTGSPPSLCIRFKQWLQSREINPQCAGASWKC